jgi:hypothetical protein
MDVTTQIRLLWLGGLAALYGVALGTVWLLGGWQHRLEQRRSRLLDSVRRLVCRTDVLPFPVTLAIKPGRRRGQPSCRLTATA